MDNHRPTRFTRRAFLGRGLAVPVALVLAACSGRSVSEMLSEMRGADSASLPPTPACDDDDAPTLAQTEGPFFTPDSPLRTSLLEPGITGTTMTLTGYVLSTDCQPIAGALVDFWHADDSGAYDNVGYRLRGHQFTDANGRYTLETIIPGLYPGRTRHFHVKVQAANQPVLTTQLYFPDEPANQRDGIYRPELEMTMPPGSDAASFNFVLALT